MRDGFIKVAAGTPKIRVADCRYKGTPKIRVADCRYNAEQIFTMMREADKQGVKVLCLPELCLTGYTCGDLFLQDTLLCGAEEGLQTILEATRNLDMVTVLGLPVRCKWDNKLYNCAAVIQSGEILGLVPKTYLPNYGEFYEQRWFASGAGVETSVDLCGETVDMDAAGLFACEKVPNLVLGVEICEDLWATEPPSARLARGGATVILNLSASNELVGKSGYRRNLVVGQSGRLVCGYVYADAGEGESTTDLVFTGHNMIAENGALLAERRFATGLTISEIDVDRLAYERRRMTTFNGQRQADLWRASFSLPLEETRLTRAVSPAPFVPADAEDRAERCNEILKIAALGLKKRLEHTGARTAVVGLSGGLDSRDHMSMYGVNAGIPKTLVRHLVAFVSDDKGSEDPRLSAVLDDILDTPVSPELLPAIEGKISQKTEDLVGPYELHDFFLYYAIRWGFPPRKVFRLAEHALGRTYDRATILKWLNSFYRRFFTQQFKRSCLPDGPKVGSVTLSPRGDWRMPSDAVAALWLEELEGLE